MVMRIKVSSLKLLRSAIFAALAVCSVAVHGSPVSGQGTWETTLQARDLNGDGITDAFYDTALNITWLANWNVNGNMSWNDAMTWAAGLNVYGMTGWRLPSALNRDGTGPFREDVCNCVDSELYFLWHTELGNVTVGSLYTYPQPNTGNFTNLEVGDYWSSTLEFVGEAWMFQTSDGYGMEDASTFSLKFAVAVRDGDVAFDTTPPVLTLPANITQDATSPQGAIVNYAVTATDNSGVTPTVSCIPKSGLTFAIGPTTVNCTATDATGNSSTGSFTVTVNGAVEQLTNLIFLVGTFNSPFGLTNRLNNKLEHAIDALEAMKKNSVARACNKLSAFIDVAQSQSGNKLTVGQANQLIASASQIRAVLGCP
jgi:hypothetical protein